MCFSLTNKLDENIFNNFPNKKKTSSFHLDNFSQIVCSFI